MGQVYAWHRLVFNELRFDKRAVAARLQKPASGKTHGTGQ
jgi:hypothetical protein